MYNRVCPRCDNDFTTRHKHQTYCSRRCYSQHDQRHCVVCEQPFWSKHPSKCCSPECGGIYKRTYERHERNCLQCDKAFVVTAQSRNKRFCSRQCARSASRLTASRPCAFCGKIFTPQSNRIAGLYCSMDCYGRANRNPDSRRSGDNFTNTQRRAVMKRDSFACVICGATIHLEVDHVIAVRDGGTKTIDNGQTLCYDCHHAKSRREKQRWAFERRQGHR